MPIVHPHAVADVVEETSVAVVVVAQAVCLELDPVARGLHSFPFPLNFELISPLSAYLELLCPPYDPN